MPCVTLSTDEKLLYSPSPWAGRHYPRPNVTVESCCEAHSHAQALQEGRELGPELYPGDGQQLPELLKLGQDLLRAVNQQFRDLPSTHS